MPSAEPPTNRHPVRDAALWAIVVVGAATYVGYGGVVGDELGFMADARRMTQGALPYRDFWAHTTPLGFWLPAALFLVVGPSLLAVRILAALALVATAWLAARAARACGAGPWTSLLPAAGLVWALYRIWPVYSHHWLAMGFAVAALAAAGHGLAGGKRVVWGLSGVATALAILAVQADGMIAAIAIACALGLAAACGHGAARERARDAGWWAVGLAAPLALAALHFLSQGILATALYYQWVWPFQGYKSAGGVNDIAYATDLPQLLQPVTQLPFWYGRAYHFVFLLALLPLAAAGAITWGLGLLARRRAGTAGWTAAEAHAVPWAFAAAGFFVLTTRGRADFIHAAYYALPALVVAAAAASWLSARLAATGGGWTRWVPQGLLAAYVATGAFIHVREMRAAPAVWLSAESPDARLARVPAVAYLRERARPGDTVAAMPMGGLYYFFALPPAVSASLVIPPAGKYMTEADFDRLWGEIEARKPRFLVIVPYLAGREDLAAFLRPPARAYRLARTFPESEFPGFPTHVFERDAGAAPPMAPARSPAAAPRAGG